MELLLVNGMEVDGESCGVELLVEGMNGGEGKVDVALAVKGTE